MQAGPPVPEGRRADPDLPLPALRVVAPDVAALTHRAAGLRLGRPHSTSSKEDDMGSTSEQVVATMEFRAVLDDGRTIPIMAPRVRFPSQADAEAAAYASSGRSGDPERTIDQWLAIASEFGGIEEVLA
jgi:hypothetical protein